MPARSKSRSAAVVVVVAAVGPIRRVAGKGMVTEKAIETGTGTKIGIGTEIEIKIEIESGSPLL
jgi:hypothetical protein